MSARLINPHGPNHREAATRAVKEHRTSGSKPHPANALFYDLSADEREFADAIAAWQHRTGRRFPTHSETLAILRSLGYVRLSTEGGAQ